MSPLWICVMLSGLVSTGVILEVSMKLKKAHPQKHFRIITRAESDVEDDEFDLEVPPWMRRCA